MMKRNSMVMLVICMSLALLLSAGTSGADRKEKKEQSEEDMGIRKETLYDETKAMPAHGEYGHDEPGKSKKIKRAFENSPPLIPHDLTGMLPIAETNNVCLNCHMPEHAAAIGATMIPKSHFFDLDTGADLKGKLDGKRIGCMQCHVPQVNIPVAVENTFKADFRKKKDMTSSHLLDSLNEGVKNE